MWVCKLSVVSVTDLFNNGSWNAALEAIVKLW